MYKGLQLAINLNFEELVCFSDSLLAVNLINRDTSLFHVYVVLIQDIKDPLNCKNYSIHHSLKEGNHYADFMAKLEASRDVDLTVHSSPPEDLLPKLRTGEIGTLFLRI